MGASGTSGGLDYRPRLADNELAEMLRATGAVVIEGPRASGKTATARQAARSEVRLDVDTSAREAGLLEPSVLLDGARPRLIDEWQLVPAIWNQVRREIDDLGGQPGQFILTGSVVPADDVTRHSGAMRMARLRMRPMSLAEAGYSSGAISLAGLFEGAGARAPDSGHTIRSLADRIAVGGWPGLQNRTPPEALGVTRAYLSETSRVDLVRLDGVKRDPQNVMRVIRSVARHVSTAASARAIAADVGGADGPVDRHTVLAYLQALTRVFVVEDLPAWSPRLRSRSLMRGAATRHFVDPSLAVAALNATPDRLVLDPATLGFLFEDLVIRDLRIYAQGMDAEVFHYRDSTDLEADAIVETRDGRWAAFEVKLGQMAIDAAAANLLKVADRVDIDRHGSPAALAVITGWGFGYTRPDGVHVIPIGALAA